MVDPLTAWNCDTCHGPIDVVGMGLVTWRDSPQGRHDFRIVHKVSCDPGKEHGFIGSLDLPFLLGVDGLVAITSLASLGPLHAGPGGTPRADGIANIDEFVDLLRRLQLPYYEQARPFFADQQDRLLDDGMNETFAYLPSTLQRIAERGEREVS